MKNSLLIRPLIPLLRGARGVLLLFSLLITLKTNAQKEDYNWIFGSNQDGTGVNHFTWDDNLNLIKDTVMTTANFYLTNAAISDSLGNLALYSNGRAIYDGQTHQIIENGDSIGFGWYWNFTAPTNDLSLPQSNFFLKSIEKPNTYILFHLWMDTLFSDSSSFYNGTAVKSLAQTEIQFINNEFVVTKKNEEILIDTLSRGAVTACRHANGRDWWIVCQEAFSNCVNVMLYTPDTIYLHHKDCFGYDYIQWTLGYSKFSSNGEKYIFANGILGIKIYDFDRCSGQLSFKDHIPRNVLMEVSDPFFYYFGHFAISPNSQYLYTGAPDSLFQFNLLSNDIANSIELVGWIPEDSLASYTVLITTLSPDGKIIQPNSVNSYGVIHSPNEIAANVDLELGIPLYKTPSNSVGNFPNYRLGRLIGSPCDTLIDTTIAIRELIELNVLEAYPNPAHTKIRIDYAGKFWERVSNLKLEVTDILSRTYYNKSLPEYSAFQILDIADYPKGVYFVYLKDEGKVLGTLKFVKR